MLEIRTARRLALAAAVCGAAACSSYTDPPVDTDQPEFITVRRAWAPGERAAAVAAITSSGAWSLPYVGDLSPMADQLLHPDSTDEIVANPAFSPSAMSPFTGRFGGGLFNVTRLPGTGWSAFGLDIRIVDNSQSPADSNNWLGLMWYNNAEPDWKGFVFVATANTTIGQITVSTIPFDASEAKSGAGGGEFRQSTATYWEARDTENPNTIEVSVNDAAGVVSDVGSGAFTGGTQQTRSMNVRFRRVGFTRISGPTDPPSQLSSFTHNGAGYALTCVFPSPCTGEP